MDTQTLTILLIGAFFAWMLYIGYRTHTGRNKSELRENFLIGNRNVSAFLVAVGITMGWFDATQFGFTTALGYDDAWGGLFYAIAGASPFLFLALFAGKLRDSAAKNGAYMIGNYFGRFYSSRCAALVGLCTGIYLLIWLSMQFSIAATVFSAFTGLPGQVTMVALALVTFAYLQLGGFLASIRTDLALFTFCVLLLIISTLLLVPSVGQWFPSPRMLVTASSSNYIGWLNIMVLNFGSSLVAPDVWQRIYSAEGAQQARRSMLYTSLLIMFMQGSFAALGIYIHSLGLASDSTALAPVVLSLIPAIIQPLAVLIFMAAVMSTVATAMFGSAMSFCSDIGVEMKWLKQAQLLIACRYIMVVTMLVGLGITYLPLDIITVGFTCLGASACVVPLACTVFFGWKVAEPAAFYSLLITLICYALGAWYQIYTGPLALMPLLIAIGTLLLFEGLSRRK